MTKRELVRIVGTGCTTALASAMVEAVFTAMMNHLVDEDRVEIRGFGSFTVRHVRARPNARNPRTGETLYVPPRRKVKFRPGVLLREALHEPPPASAPGL